MNNIYANNNACFRRKLPAIWKKQPKSTIVQRHFGQKFNGYRQNDHPGASLAGRAIRCTRSCRRLCRFYPLRDPQAKFILSINPARNGCFNDILMFL